MGGLRGGLYPAGVTFVVVDAIAVALRFWARISKRAVGYDDVAMAVSYVGFVIFVSFALVAVSNGAGTTTVVPQFKPTIAAKYLIIATVVYIPSTGILKLAVGLVLLRLAKDAYMHIVRIILIVAMIVMSVMSIVTCLVFALQCRPLSVAWGEGTGTCVSATVLGNTGVSLSVVDVTLMPIYMLRKARLPTRVRLSILILLGLGAMSSIAVIIRMKSTIEVRALSSSKSGLADPRLIQELIAGIFYSILEIGLGILAAALTTVRTLIKKIPCVKNLCRSDDSGARRLVIPWPQMSQDDGATITGDTNGRREGDLCTTTPGGEAR